MAQVAEVDLIVVDLDAQGLNDRTFLAMLDADVALRHTPVLAITDQDRAQIRVPNLPRVIVLTKPFNARTLVLHAEGLLGDS